MKKTFRKVIALSLAVVIVLCAAPLSGIADLDWSKLFTVKANAESSETVTYIIQNNEVIITGAVSANVTEITIPDYIDGYPVTKIQSNAFSRCDNLETLYIPASVTDMGNCIEISYKSAINAYYGGTLDEWINAIHFAKENSYNYDVNPFNILYVNEDEPVCLDFHYDSYCDSVTVQLNYYIETAPETLTIPAKIGNVNITDLGRALYNNYNAQNSIKSIIIEDGIKQVSSDIFSHCKNLEKLYIPASVTDMGNYIQISSSSINAYYDGTLDEWINAIHFAEEDNYNYDVNPFNKLYVNGDEPVYLDFHYDSYDNKVTVELNYNIETAPETLTIPAKIGNVNITDLGRALYNNYNAQNSIKTIIIEDGIKQVSSDIFSHCKNLEKLYIPASVTDMGNHIQISSSSIDAHYGGTLDEWINAIHFAEEDSYNDVNPFNILYVNGDEPVYLDFHYDSYDNKVTVELNYNIETAPETLTIPAKIGNVNITDLGRALYNNYNAQNSIKTIIIEDGINQISSDVFSYCENLETLYIPASVTNIGDNICSTYNSKLKDVYFDGSRSQWENIIGDNNYALMNADIHFSGHEHYYTSEITTAATCSDDGVKTYTCECGDTYTEVIPLTGHTMGEWTFAADPNDAAKVMLRRECINCNYYEEMEHSHEYISVVTMPATCSDDGIRTYTCECGCTYTEVIPSTGHIMSNWKIVVEPTTTVKGLLKRECKLCDYCEEFDMGYADVDRVKGVTISSQSEIVKLGESVTLTATVVPETAGDKSVTWSSYDTTVASVENGVVTANGVGSTVIIVQTNDGGYKDFCLVKVAGITAAESTSAFVDSEKGLIYGLAPNLDNLDGFVDIISDELSLECNSEKLGTGSVVNIVKDGIVVDSYEIVIIGDTTGDSWYDGMDSLVVNCLAAGMLTKEQVGEAVYMAADCNHDDVIDEADVVLLEQAGIILASVDQTKSAAELLEDEVFCEYINLIDQNPAKEALVEEASEDVTPAEKPVDESVNQSILRKIISFLTYIFDIIMTCIGL